MDVVVALITISDPIEFTQVLALVIHTQIAAQERDWDTNGLRAVYLFAEHSNLKSEKTLMSQAVPFWELRAKMKRKEVAERKNEVEIFFLNFIASDIKLESRSHVWYVEPNCCKTK